MAEAFKNAMDEVTLFFELAGVVAIIAGFVYGVVRAYMARGAHGGAETPYEAFRATFGRAVLVGLEILVAADLIRTIAVEPTMDNLWVLALLVAIRTFLSWSLEVEIDGRWPWRRNAAEQQKRCDQD